MFRRISGDNQTNCTNYTIKESQLIQHSRSPTQIISQLGSPQNIYKYKFNDPQKFRVSNVSPKFETISICNSKAENSNLIELYKKQNDNLKEQNEYLLEKLRQYKKNELNLLNYIKQLQSGRCDANSQLETEESNVKHRIDVKMVQKNPQSTKNILSKSKSGDFFNKENKNSNIRHLHSHSSVQDLFQLNKQFCQQMKKSSKQSNFGKRKVIRQSMAKIACDMKSIREHMRKSD